MPIGQCGIDADADGDGVIVAWSVRFLPIGEYRLNTRLNPPLLPPKGGIKGSYKANGQAISCFRGWRWVLTLKISKSKQRRDRITART